MPSITPPLLGRLLMCTPHEVPFSVRFSYVILYTPPEPSLPIVSPPPRPRYELRKTTFLDGRP